MSYINLNNFMKVGEALTIKGFLTSEKGVTLDFSPVLSKLIGVAGEWCKTNASDLFIAWFSLIERMKSPGYHGEVLILGFKEDGIDPTRYVMNELSTFEDLDIDEVFASYCGGIWCVEVDVAKALPRQKIPVRMTLSMIVPNPIVNRR